MTLSLVIFHSIQIAFKLSIHSFNLRQSSFRPLYLTLFSPFFMPVNASRSLLMNLFIRACYCRNETSSLRTRGIPTQRGAHAQLRQQPHTDSDIPDSENPTLPKPLPGWPESVRCEMNVKVWESALKAAKLDKEFEDVIEGFLNGFDQGIPEYRIRNLSSYTPPNHSSAILAEAEIRESIALELRTG